MAAESDRETEMSVLGGWLLGVLGALLTIVGFVLWRLDPSATLNPLVAIVWATAGVVMVAVGILMLGFPRSRVRRTSRSWTARLAMLVGFAGLLAFMFLVVIRATPSRDGTMSDAALFVPTALGLVAMGLGAGGIATSRGDGPSLRWSLAGLIMGIGSVAIPIWLWLSHRYFFSSYFNT